MAKSAKLETGKEDASVEGNGDGNGQVPPGQTEDGDGNIVNNGSNMAPGLNRGDKIDKPENPNKPDKPENPGTEDKDDKKANKANKGTHIYTYDELNRMVSSEIAKELTNYTYDTLGNLVLETSKNKSVDYVLMSCSARSKVSRMTRVLNRESGSRMLNITDKNRLPRRKSRQPSISKNAMRMKC